MPLSSLAASSIGVGLTSAYSRSARRSGDLYLTLGEGASFHLYDWTTW